MSKKSLIAAAVGTAFAATLAAPVASAASNPFALSALASGYQVADNTTPAKPMEGKCGAAAKPAEGKCGASKEVKMKDGKCGEGKCGATKKGDASKAEAGTTSPEK